MKFTVKKWKLGRKKWWCSEKHPRFHLRNIFQSKMDGKVWQPKWPVSHSGCHITEYLLINKNYNFQFIKYHLFWIAAKVVTEVIWPKPLLSSDLAQCKYRDTWPRLIWNNQIWIEGNLAKVGKCQNFPSNSWKSGKIAKLLEYSLHFFQ